MMLAAALCCLQQANCQNHGGRKILQRARSTRSHRAMEDLFDSITSGVKFSKRRHGSEMAAFQQPKIGAPGGKPSSKALPSLDFFGSSNGSGDKQVQSGKKRRRDSSSGAAEVSLYGLAVMVI